MEDLIIFDEKSRSQLPSESGSENYKMFKAIDSLKSFDRKKRSWYTKKNLTELITKIFLYPHSPHIIRR